MQINLDEARKFLSNLFLDNKEELVFTTFCDDKSLPNEEKARLTGQYIGTFEEYKDTLISLNNKGAGIFVTVNHSDGLGRKKANIIGINAVWIEADDGMPTDVPINASMIVTSSVDKYHYYFLTSADVTPERADEFDGVMHTMVKDHKSDPNAKDLTRVLRIPGFYHLKDAKNPIKVTLTSVVEKDGNAKRYTWDKILKSFPPSKKNKRFTSAARSAKGPEHVPKTTQIVNMLTHVDPSSTRIAWLNTIMSLHHEYSGSDEGLAIAQQWSRGEFTESKSTPLNWESDDDVTTRWNSLDYTSAKSHRTLGSLRLEATTAGWKPEEYKDCALKFIDTETNDVLKKIDQIYAVSQMPGGGSKIIRRNPDSGKYVMESPSDMTLFLSGITVPQQDKDGAVKRVPASKVWLSSPSKLRFDNMVFKPEPNLYTNDDTKSIIWEDPDPSDTNPYKSKTLNSFFGLHINPTELENYDHSHVMLVKDLFLRIAADGDQETATYLMKYAAHLRQRPQTKTKMMITFMGDKGSGKSVISELYQGLMEPFVYVTSDFADVIGQFNAHIVETVLLLLEEAVWGARPQDNSKLKDLITAPRIASKQKYITNNSDAQNFINIIATANPGFSVPEDMRSQERRFLTISVSNKELRNNKYFAQFGNPGSPKRTKILSDLATHLDTIDITDFDPSVIPAKVGKHARYNQIESSGGMLKFLLHCIETDELIPDQTKQTSTFDFTLKDSEITSINDMWMSSKDSVYLSAKTIKIAYENFARHSRSSVIDQVHVIDELEKFVPLNHFSKRTAAPKSLCQKYSHLVYKNKVVKIPNRKQAITHLVSEGVIDKDKYKGEY